MKKQNKTLDHVRKQTRKELEMMLGQFESYFNLEKNQFFWQALHKKITLTIQEKQRIRMSLAFDQLKHYPLFLKSVILFILDSPEHLSLYLEGIGQQQKIDTTEKAIRYSQTLLLVSSRIMFHLKRFRKLKTEEVVKDEVFLGLSEYTIEKQLIIEYNRIEEVMPYFRKK